MAKWKVTKNKIEIKPQEVAVLNLINEMADYSNASNASEFENEFKRNIVNIKRHNNFSADLMYKITARNQYSVELWKLNAQGDFKYKMLQLDHIN